MVNDWIAFALVPYTENQNDSPDALIMEVYTPNDSILNSSLYISESIVLTFLLATNGRHIRR